MNRSIFFLLLFLIFSCSKSTDETVPRPLPEGETVNEEEKKEEKENEDERTSLTEGLLVIGDTQDPISGTFLFEPFQYEITSVFSPAAAINLKEEVGIVDSDRPTYYASDEGIIFFNNETNPNTGFKDLFPYYKNFKNGITSGYAEFTTPQSLVSYGDFEGDVYGLHFDYLTLETDGSYEYFLKIIDSDDLSERKVNIGRYVANGFFRLKQLGNYLYIYHSKSLIGDGEATFIVIDLTNPDIINSLTNLPDERFELVKETSGNCYLFSADITYKYDTTSQTLIEQNVGGKTVFLSNIVTGEGVEPLVHNDILYYAVPGAQPGLQAFLPSTYNLVSGETKFIEIKEGTTQFEQDPFEWQPTYTALKYDIDNNFFYLGVRSAGFTPDATSYGVFVVDFEGTILEKVKVPIRPLKIVK